MKGALSSTMYYSYHIVGKVVRYEYVYQGYVSGTKGWVVEKGSL
jgi:hypothetical protein